MKSNINFGLLFNRIIGAVILLLGAWVVIDPTILTSLYGISLETSEARSTIRSVIGGTEIVLAFVFLMPSAFGLSQKNLHLLGFAIFTGIVISRFGHILLDGPVALKLQKEIGVEFFIALTFFILVCFNR